MEVVIAGDALVDGQLVGRYELTRIYDSRLVPVRVGHRTTYRPAGGESEASIVFPQIFSSELRLRLQRMVDAQVSVAARRRLRNEGAAGVAVVLELEDDSALEASVQPPSFPHQPADRPGSRCRSPGSQRGTRVPTVSAEHRTPV